MNGVLSDLKQEGWQVNISKRKKTLNFLVENGTYFKNQTFLKTAQI